ncbi:hypothetical protein pb186bvf_005759 [Paramecium bursaria]
MQTQYIKREMFRKNLRDDQIKQFYKSKRANIVVPDENIRYMIQADNFEFIDILTKISFDYVDQLVNYGAIDYFYRAFQNKKHQENAIFALANLSQNDDIKIQIFNLKIHYQIIQDLEEELKDLESLCKKRFQKIYYRLWFLNSQCDILEDYELIKKYEDIFLQFLNYPKKKVKYECLYGFLKLPCLIDYYYVLEACMKQRQNKLNKLNIIIVKVLSKILNDKLETLQLVMDLGIIELIEIQITQVQCKSHIYIILSRLCQYYCEQIFQNDTICQEIKDDSHNPKFKGKLLEIFRIILWICPITIFHLLLARIDLISIIHSFLDDEHFVIDNYETLCQVLFRIINITNKYYQKEFEDQILKYVNSKNEEVSKQFECLL